MDDVKAAEETSREQLKHYKKLKAISKSTEFNDYFDYQIELVADKLIWGFTSDNIKSWEDFCRVRGEIVARLQPIQEIYGAESMLKTLQAQLDTYYKKQL